MVVHDGAFMNFNKLISRGVLKVGQEIEIRPGLVSKDSEGPTPIFLHC